MGIDHTFGLAFAKSQTAAGDELPDAGAVFMSLADRDKAGGTEVARRFVDLGFEILATEGTARYLREHDVAVAVEVAKVGEPTPAEGSRTDAVALIASGRVHLVVNTPRGRGPRADGAHIRSAANVHKVACLTTLAAARAAAAGIADTRAHPLSVVSLQEYHRGDQLRLSLD